MNQIRITKRQKQLLGMLLAGKSNIEIAADLQLSANTIKVHLWRLYTRIGVNSRTQALSWWQENRTDDPVSVLVRTSGALISALSVPGGAFAAELADLQKAYTQIKGAKA